jgi:hypothetical protein
MRRRPQDSPMGIALDDHAIRLVAQVRKASSEHRVDPQSGLLRGQNFPKPNKVVYLGDIAKAVLTCLDLPETPRFIEMPEYNEQKWKFITRSGDIEVTITSRPYWFFGLFTSGYLNILEFKGDFSVCTRIIFDIISVLPQPPWEMSHIRSYDSFARNQELPSFDENAKKWKRYEDHASEELTEAIEHIQVRAHQSKSISREETEFIEAELSFARKSLMDRNAPAVERALSRIEAMMISSQLGNQTKESMDSETETILFDEVPFVDYSSNLTTSDE